MGSSTSPTPNGSAINSPSDASYTSRTSHTSTRTTSPATSSHRPSPLLPLNHLNRVHLEPTSNTLLELQTEMERNAFQSINMRRDKLIAERVTDGTTSSSNSQLPRSFQPTQPQRPGASLGSLAARGLTSNNWRAQQMSDSLYIPFGSVGSASYGHVDREPTLFPVGTQARMDSQSSLLAYPIIANYYDSQLDSCYAYCFDRGNGRYTRLIPADMLPPLQNIPALQQGCQGMIVVPTPHAFPANGRSSNDEQVILRTPPASPTTPADNIQSRIDTIVASVPSTPTHQSHNSSGGVTSHSYHHDHHGGSTPSAGGGPHHQQIQRRAKVYCDKWVHEGVCAFTQQGCKYKHEMPFDKVTQHQLGLFHGLPAWWKKHQAELARQRDAPQGIDSESVLEISDGGGHGGSIMNDGIPGANNDMMRDSISNIQRSRLGAISGSTTAKLAWREQNEHSLDDKSNVNNQSQDRSLFGISNSSGGVGGGLHGGISASVWNHSPFGPIAPPQRSAIRTLQATNSPTRSSVPGYGNMPIANPYAALEALDNRKLESSDGARLG